MTVLSYAKIDSGSYSCFLDEDKVSLSMTSEKSFTTRTGWRRLLPLSSHSVSTISLDRTNGRLSKTSDSTYTYPTFTIHQSPDSWELLAHPLDTKVGALSSALSVIPDSRVARGVLGLEKRVGGVKLGLRAGAEGGRAGVRPVGGVALEMGGLTLAGTLDDGIEAAARYNGEKAKFLVSTRSRTHRLCDVEFAGCGTLFVHPKVYLSGEFSVKDACDSAAAACDANGDVICGLVLTPEVTFEFGRKRAGLVIHV